MEGHTRASARTNSDPSLEFGLFGMDISVDPIISPRALSFRVLGFEIWDLTVADLAQNCHPEGIG